MGGVRFLAQITEKLKNTQKKSLLLGLHFRIRPPQANPRRSQLSHLGLAMWLEQFVHSDALAGVFILRYGYLP